MSFLLLLVLTGNLFAATSSTIAPSTTNNDDSCDIGVAPAATLLLPHFEVELNGTADTARTTVFNVINVSSSPQIARVTLWTDWSYPALSFSIFLTGYDVEAVDLRDLLVRGAVPTKVEMPGPMSKPNFSNENFTRTVAQDCGLRMPHVPSGVMKDVRAYLTNGRSNSYALSCQSAPGVEERVGSDHGSNIAAGYVTIDVVATCAPTMPNSPKYFTSELLFDNVLTGDYVAIEPSGTTNGYAGGSPLVHIRAIPEGGAAGSIVPTRLPYTFYDRFTTIDESTPRTIDRRQPLPSTFAARWIDGGETGFATSYSIWREALTGANAACGEYAANSNMPVADLVRFDEHENAAVARQAASRFFPSRSVCLRAPPSSRTRICSRFSTRPTRRLDLPQPQQRRQPEHLLGIARRVRQRPAQRLVVPAAGQPELGRDQPVRRRSLRRQPRRRVAGQRMLARDGAVVTSEGGCSRRNIGRRTSIRNPGYGRGGTHVIPHDVSMSHCMNSSAGIGLLMK